MRFRRLNDIDALSKIGIFSIFMLVSIVSLGVFSPICVSQAAEEPGQSEEEPPLEVGIFNDGKTAYANKLEFNITPTSVGVFDFKRVNFYAYTESSGGFESYFSTSSSDTSMKNTDKDTKAAIMSDFSGEVKSNEMASNEWGYSFDRTNFSALPSSDEPKLIRNITSYPAYESQYFTEVTFGVKVDTSLPSGSYSQDLVYTVIGHAPRGASVYWDLKNGILADESYPSTVEYGEKIDLTKFKPTRKDFTFAGWTNGTQTFDGTETEADINPDHLDYITMKALWSHPPAGFHTISNMQDMTRAICNATTTPSVAASEFDWDGSHYGDDEYVPRTRLMDTRDGKYYLVSKLADGVCRMSQNLDYELVEGETIIASKLDGTTMEVVSPITTQTEDGVAWETGSNYWHSFKPPYAYSKRGVELSNEPSGEGYEYDWEKTGILYSYQAASAGTGPRDEAGSGSGDASASICPRGWRLALYWWPKYGVDSWLDGTYKNYFSQVSEDKTVPFGSEPFNYIIAGIYEDWSGEYITGWSGLWTGSKTWAPGGSYFTSVSFGGHDHNDGRDISMSTSGGDSGNGYNVRCVCL